MWDGVVLLVLAVAASLHALHFSHLADDAYISFRFAANLAEGHGLVFNPGEYVMGYSNFLWVVGLAGFEFLGWRAPSAAPVLGVLLGCGVLTLVYGHLRTSLGSIWAAAAGAGLLASNGTFALWLVGGLEGPLFAFWLTAAAIVAIRIEAGSTLRPFVALGTLLGLAAWTRPEGVFYAIPIGLFLLVRQRDGRRLRSVGVCAAIVLACYALFVLGAWAYYGDPLPNPFYTKFHPLSLELLIRGASIALWFVEGYWGAPLLVVVLWAAVCGGRVSSPGWLPLLLIGTFVAFFVRVGGDGQAYYRMWFWVLPMFGLLLGETVAALLALDRRGPRVACAALVVTLLGFNVQHSVRGDEIERVRSDEALGRDAILIARRLAEVYPGATVAANNIGVLGYVSRLPVLDMLGLTDRHIAKAPGKPLGFPSHESHDGAYVLDQAPDLIFYGIPLAYPGKVARGRVLAVAYGSDRDLLEDVRFQREYRFEHLDLQDGRFAPLFRRRDGF